MSHFTTIKTQIKDIDALRSAVQEMGLSLLQKTTARGYYENNIKGDYVIRLKGPYDVAVNKEKEGTFDLTCTSATVIILALCAASAIAAIPVLQRGSALQRIGVAVALIAPVFIVARFLFWVVHQWTT